MTFLGDTDEGDGILDERPLGASGNHNYGTDVPSSELGGEILELYAFISCGTMPLQGRWEDRPWHRGTRPREGRGRAG